MGLAHARRGQEKGMHMDELWAWLFTPIGLLILIVALWNWDCLF
jgi:hypothetical protein